MLVFGGCNVRGPLYRAAGQWQRDSTVDWDDVPSGMTIGGPHFFTFTIGEMLQALECWRGELQIPSELFGLCHMMPEFAPTAANSPVAQCDLALVEPNTSVEIEFDGYFLNRGPFVRFLAPLKEISDPVKRLSSQWYNKGIVGANDKMRSDLAAQLIPQLPDDTPDRELTVEILRRAKGTRRDMFSGLRLMTEALGMPFGVVTYTWSYMPDGRAVSWPAEFHDAVVGAALDLELPLFEASHHVKEAGLEFALKADRRHYTEAFMPVLAVQLIDFARRVRADATNTRS